MGAVHLKLDGIAATLAVFDVGLNGQRGVYQNRNLTEAVRAGVKYLFHIIFLLASQARKKFPGHLL